MICRISILASCRYSNIIYVADIVVIFCIKCFIVELHGESTFLIKIHCSVCMDAGPALNQFDQLLPIGRRAGVIYSQLFKYTLQVLQRIALGSAPHKAGPAWMAC
jgi:hypothetical protein